MNITPATKNMKPQWKLLWTNIDQSSACFVLKGNIAYTYRINTHRNGVHLRIFRMKHLSELNSDYKFSMALPILHSLEEEAKTCWPRVDIHSVPLSCRIRKLSNCGVEEDSWESLGQPIKPVHPKGYHPWIFIGGLMMKLKLQYCVNLMRWALIGKDSDAGKDWGLEEKEVTEDDLILWMKWHHGLNGHEFEQTQGDSEGQGSLVVLQPVGSQRVGRDLATEQQQWASFAFKARVLSTWPMSKS